MPRSEMFAQLSASDPGSQFGGRPTICDNSLLRLPATNLSGAVKWLFGTDEDVGVVV